MDQMLDIRDVARRSGITSRALRFYEARGLLAPLRTASGRRIYSARELERLNQILALKRAGLSLAQIQGLLGRTPVDLERIVDAQLEAIAARTAELQQAKALLLSVKSRIGRSEPVDVATFCSLIKQGNVIMETESWKKVADRYFSPEQQAHWAERMKDAPASFDSTAYNQKWIELGQRVAAALPLDPRSAEANALYDEWQALLAPFTAVATPEMMAGATNLYERMGEWEGERQPPFTMAVWRFIQSVAAARKAQA
jgi:DNA-binding transcriptional MerR regulator